MSYSTATVIVPSGPHELKARTSVGGRVLSIIFFLSGLGAILSVAAGDRLLPVRIPLPVAAILGFVGVIFCLAGLLFWGRQELTFERRRGSVRLKRAVKGLGRAIPFGDIEAVEMVQDDDAAIAGKIDLVLSRPAGRRLAVAMRHAEGKLQEDARRLGEFLGVPVRDARQAVVSAAGAGPQITVSRRFNGKSGAANFRTHERVQWGPGLLVVQATRRNRMFRSFFLWGGAGSLLLGALMLGLGLAGTTDSLWGSLASAAIFLTIGAVFVLASVRLMACPPVFLDLTQGKIRGNKMRIAGRLVEEIPLTLVVAVQIVSGWIRGDSETPSYTAFEINLVLSQPPGERLAVTAHSKEIAIRSDAQRLAEFLNVPLLDHTAGDGGTPTMAAGTAL